MAAFASRSGDLEATIRLLPPTLQAANTAFDALNRAFPPTRAFALELIPGVEQTPATIDAAYPWIAQVQKLVSPSELGGLVNALRPTTADLANVANATLQLLPKVDLVDRCVTDVVLPTGDVKIADGPFTTGLENYKQFWESLVGLAGEGQNFDGNGQYVRFQAGGGATTISTGNSTLTGDPLFGNALAVPLGTRPAYTGQRPPYKPDAPCYQQTPPDLNGPAAQVGPPDQTVGTGPSNPLAPTVPLPALTVPGTGVTLDKRAKQKKSLAGKIADGLNPFSSSKQHKRAYTPTGGANKPTIEAQDTPASKSAKGTKTTADAGNPAHGHDAMNAIRKHAREFTAVIVLILIALLVGGYILSQQRFNLPGWVPILGKNFFTLKAEFSTAQAVTPGQGQTVDIAGVAVGEIQNVQLKNGRALVTMNIREKYDTIYPDATMLLRPKTGLKDMVISMDPGNPSSGKKLKNGATIPVNQTLPDVNVDEILAALDTDTRAYLRLLLGGAGQGLRDNTADLSSTLRRFAPTSRDLAKITSQLKERRVNIRRTVHNFQLLANALGDKDAQLTQLVDSTNAVFRAFASEDQNIQATLAQLPPTLTDTQVTLRKLTTLGNTLGPTLQALLPGARALGPSLAATRPFLRESTPIIRDQIRPFTVAALPTVQALQPAAQDLAALTPDLSTSFDVLNYALNELAYNPPGATEGYLFWLSWLNQLGPAIFSTQDAHGPIRRGQFLVSCTSAGVLAQVAKVNPLLKTILDLLNPVQQSQVCPGQAGAGSGVAPAPTVPTP